MSAADNATEVPTLFEGIPGFVAGRHSSVREERA